MLRLWDFFKDPNNLTVIAGLCGGIVVVAGWTWAVLTFLTYHKKTDDKKGGGTNLAPSGQGAASGRDTIIERLVRWGIFGVTVSLLPLVFSYVSLLLKAQAATVAIIVGNGELLVIVWALCAGALARIMQRFDGYGALGAALV
jgi:hypothetical protein